MTPKEDEEGKTICRQCGKATNMLFYCSKECAAAHRAPQG